MRAISNHITVHERPNNNNQVTIHICDSAFKAIGSPKYVVFSETNLRIKVPSAISNGEKMLGTGVYQAQITPVIHHTPVASLIGKWEYEIDDLSIYLTNKIS